MNNMIDSTSDYNSLQTNNVYMNEMINSTADYNSFAHCRPCHHIAFWLKCVCLIRYTIIHEIRLLEKYMSILYH